MKPVLSIKPVLIIMPLLVIVPLLLSVPSTVNVIPGSIVKVTSGSIFNTSHTLIVLFATIDQFVPPVLVAMVDISITPHFG